MNGFRDIELLSTYLDGALSPAESARLESRITSEPELASVFEDLRAARGILRKLPVRKAPRNFLLTRKMVRARPPLPRAYSFFRFSSVLATALLMITFASNFLGSNVSFGAAGAAAPAPPLESGGGPGMGGGGDGPSFLMPFAGAAATEAPAAAQAAAATGAPAATEAPALESQPESTLLAPSLADSARLAETPTMQPAASSTPELAPAAVEAGKVAAERPVFTPGWQILLALVALLSGLGALIVQRSAKSKWI